MVVSYATHDEVLDVAVARRMLIAGESMLFELAKRSAELYGEHIHCESQVAEGTTIRFELPADRPATGASAAH